MKVKSVIFDLDGTLLNTLETIMECNNEVFKKHGYPARTLLEFRNFVGDGMKMLIKKALPAGTTDEEIGQILLEVIETYHKKGTDSIPPYDGICELLDNLVQKGIKISVLTNKEHGYAQLNMKAALNRFHFEAVLGERKGIPMKPDPFGVYEIVEITGVPLEETVFVGDMKADILTGKNAGIFTVGCLWGFGNKKDLEDNGADLLIEHPLELLRIVD
ncbi:MAG: HAD family hydrolase [bacterium]